VASKCGYVETGRRPYGDHEVGVLERRRGGAR
jgi:hypothetical protein